MTSDRWRQADLREMLLLAGGALTPRRLHLFNLWCCQMLRPYLTDRRSVAAYRFAERQVDEELPTAERLEIHADAAAAVEELTKHVHVAPTAAESRRRRVYAHAALVAQQVVANDLPNRGIVSVSKLTAYVFGWANDDGRDALEGIDADNGLHAIHHRQQEAVFRDIVGDPFSPVLIAPRWRTADVIGVARGLYEDRAWSRLPMLSDALLDADCDDERIIGYCRTPGVHARSCWLLDAILELA